MIHQYYYKWSNTEAVAHPLIAIDGKTSFPLPPKRFSLPSKQDMHTWVQSLLVPSVELLDTTRAHLEIAHTLPDAQKSITPIQWIVYAEALIRQSRHRTLIQDAEPNFVHWTQWLQNQKIEVTDFPASVHTFFEHCTNASGILDKLHEVPNVEWVTALMLTMNPSQKVSPSGRSYDTGAATAMVMANNGKYGWTLSYKTTNMSNVPVVSETPNPHQEQLQEANAMVESGMIQRDQNGVWNPRLSNKEFTASDWMDQQLLTMRHNKEPDRAKVQTFVQNAITYGISQTQIIKNELSRASLKGSGFSKTLLEEVLARPWEEIERQVTILQGLGYQEELPLYLWLHFENAPKESYDLPALS